MSFFNKKEDVIDIQLTQYGKHLLSKGKLKPVFYAFFDDDVLYDSKYTDETSDETQNEIQDRINETPYLKAQHVYSSRDDSVRELTARLTNIDESDNPTEVEKTQSTVEKHFSLISPIGSSSLGTDKAPAWNITFLKGDIESSISHITGSKHDVKIPQIVAEDVLYTTQVKVDYNELSNRQIQDSLPGSLIMYADKYPDKSYIELDEDYLLLDIGEINADFDNDNFDIEVFHVEDKNVDFARSSTLRLSSQNDHINIKNKSGALDFAANEEFTIEFWIKFDFIFDYQILLSDAAGYSTTVNGVMITYDNMGDDKGFQINIGGSGGRRSYYKYLDDDSDISVITGDWYNVKLTRKKNISDQYMIHLYLNEKELKITDGATTFVHASSISLTTAEYRIGRFPDSFKGYIDEFKITKGTAQTVHALLHFNDYHGSVNIKDSSSNNLTCEAYKDAHIHVQSFEKLTPLTFLKQPVEIKNGILLDNPESGIDRFDRDNPIYSDPSYVEYWFDIFCDHEIEDYILCANQPASDARGGIFTQDALNCPEKVTTTNVADIGLIEEEMEEEC